MCQNSNNELEECVGIDWKLVNKKLQNVASATTGRLVYQSRQ